MSDFKNKDGYGSVFANQKKEGNQPDHRGTIGWNGQQLEIAMWVAETKKGDKYFKVKVQEPRSQ